MELTIDISEEEKKEVISLLQTLRTQHLEDFVVSFYEHFLKDETYNFLHESSNEELINMFSSFINIMITHLEEPFNLEEHLEILKDKHPTFKQMISFKDIFIRAFMKALSKIFNKQIDEHSDKVWHKVLENFLVFFKQNL